MKPKKTRVIAGKRYTRAGGAGTKSNAKSNADRFRRMGQAARVVAEPDGFAVYTRPGTKPPKKRAKPRKTKTRTTGINLLGW